MPINFKQLIILLVLIILFFGDTKKIMEIVKKNIKKLKENIK